MTGPRHALPILLQICDTIDQLFVEQVGPFGQMITEQARAQWLASGNKMRTSDIDEYIGLLANEIDDSGQQLEFVVAAREIVGVR